MAISFNSDAQKILDKYKVNQSATQTSQFSPQAEEILAKYGIGGRKKTEVSQSAAGSQSVGSLLPVPDKVQEEADRRNYAAQMQQRDRENAAITTQEKRINATSDALNSIVSGVDAQIASKQKKLQSATGKEKRQLNRELNALRAQKEGYARADAYQSIGNIPGTVWNTAKGAAEEWAGGHVGKLAEFAELTNEAARAANADTARQNRIAELQTQIGALQTRLNGMTEDDPEYYGVVSDINALRSQLVDQQSGLSAMNSGAKTLSDATKLMQSGQEDIAKAKELNPVGGKIGDFAVDVGAMAVQMGLDRLASAGLGLQLPEAEIGKGLEKIGAKLIGMIPFYNRAAGGAYVQARGDGGKVGGSAAYATSVGAIEVATEMIENIAAPMGKAYGAGTFDDAIESVIGKVAKKLAKTDAGRTALVYIGKVIAGGGGEFIEEVIGNAAEWQLPRIYGGDVETASDMIAQALYEGATAAVSGAGGTVMTPGSYSDARQTAAEMRSDTAQNAQDDYYAAALKNGLFSAEAAQAQRNANEQNRLARKALAEAEGIDTNTAKRDASKVYQFVDNIQNSPASYTDGTTNYADTTYGTPERGNANIDAAVASKETNGRVSNSAVEKVIADRDAMQMLGITLADVNGKSASQIRDMVRERIDGLANTQDSGILNTTENKEEMFNGGEQSAGGEGRTGGLAPAEQSAGVVGIRTEEGNVREGESNGRKNLQSDYVGGVNLGIENAVGAEEDPTKTLREETNYDSDQKAIIEYGKKRGQTVRFYRGDLWLKDKPNGTPYRVRGLIHSDGKTVWVKIDHPDYSAKQIYMHEDFHAAVKSNPKVLERGIRKLKRQYANDPAGLRNLIDRYVEKYHIDATNLSDEYILEEILADAHAGIKLDTKSKSGEVTDIDLKTADRFKKAADKAVKKRTDGNSNGGSVRFSRDYNTAIDMLDDGTLNRETDSHLQILDHTPNVYVEKAGAKDRRLIIGWDIAYLAMKKSGDLPGHYHNLGKDIMKQLPSKMSDPTFAIVKPDGRVNAILEMIKPGTNRPVLVSVEFESFKTTMQEGKNDDDTYNVVVTVMDARPNYLNNLLNNKENKIVVQKEDPAHFISRLKLLANNAAMSANDHAESSLESKTTTQNAKSQEKSSETKPVSKEAEKKYGVENVDGAVVKASRETWEETDKEGLVSDLVKAGYTKQQATRWVDFVNSVAAVIAADKARLDYESADNHTMLKKNQEYYYTLDASTLCAKRLLYQGTFDAISHRLGNQFLTSNDVIDIRKMMKDAGYEVPCGICYVESRRRHLGKYAKQWVNSYKGEYVPTVDEVTTTDGLEKLRKEHPQTYKDFMDAMAKKGSANPKVVELRAAYSEEDGLMNLTKKEIENIIRIGGMRIQSFSDFETPHLIDTMQAVLDMARLGLTSQAYTKVPNFAWVFGKTGIKINLSLIGDVDEDGNLTFDNKEGINYDEAMKLRKAYSKNVGTILVGKSDAHIRAAMKSKVIDFIIPFHRSGWGQSEYEALGLSGYSDYTALQSEVAVDYGDLDGGQLYPIDYWDYSVNGNRNARTYLEKCLDSGRLPKFLHLAFSEKTAQAFIDENPQYRLSIEDLTTADGMSKLYRKQSNKRDVAQAYFEYALENGKIENGYWKLLIDFKMYDNSGKGAPQEKVKADFNMEEARRVLGEYEGGANELPVAQDVVDKFVEKKQGTVKASREPAAEDGDVRYSREEWQEDLDRMVEDYGEMKPGEKPYRDITLPNKTEKNKNVSQTVRTVLEAKATPDEMVDNIEELVSKGEFSYEVYGDEKAIKDAEKRVTDLGWDKSLELWKKSVKSGKVNKKNTALGWTLYNNAANDGNTATAIDILNNMVEHQRNAAQALQATRILKKMEPETQLYGVARSVRNLQDELNDRYGDDKSPKLEIDQGLAEHFMKAKTEEERTKALQDIYVDIGRQMPSRFIDKLNAWRYLAMLGNPRTHIRNILGNAFFAPVVEVKNLTATGIESLVSRVAKIDRTKALVSGKGGKEILSAAWNDYANISEDALGGGKYSDLANANKYIDQGKRVFGNTKSELWNRTGGAALEGARRGNSNLLEVEDQWFSQPHYAYAMAQYCKSNGITAEQIKSGKGLEKARAYAVKEAQKATYRDTNWFSQTISGIGRNRMKSNNPGAKALGIAVEGILPFRKTPANILVRGMEYSPLGLLKSLSADLIRVKKGSITAAEAIDNISSGLTGTGLLALGIFLASQCLVRGHGGDDEKEKAFEDLTGHQNYALELPGGASITLDWMAPEALPFFIGVNLWEQTGAVGDGVTLDTVLNSISNVSEPLLEMSCLQSLNDLFESFQYSSSTSGLGKALWSTATSYLTQFVPTIFGQVERTLQENRMTTYTSKTGAINNTEVQRIIGGISAKVPGWDYRQVEYIDAWGRTEYSGGFVKRALNNFLNPAYMSEVEVSDMENELMRLYEATGESVFPSRADKTLTVNGQNIILSETQYVEYAKQKGTMSYAVVTSLTESKAYKGMSDADKAKAVKLAYDYANQMAKSNVVGFSADSWVTDAREAYEKYHLPISTFIAARVATSGIVSLKNKNGNGISNSKGLLRMKAIYELFPNITKQQRDFLFSSIDDIGDGVRGYTKAEVNAALSEMKRK